MQLKVNINLCETFTNDFKYCSTSDNEIGSNKGSLSRIKAVKLAFSTECKPRFIALMEHFVCLI